MLAGVTIEPRAQLFAQPIPRNHRVDDHFARELHQVDVCAVFVSELGHVCVALRAGRFSAQANELRLYRRIATMDATAPLPPIRDQTPTWAKAAGLAREWELNRLADRLDDLARAPRKVT